MNLDINPFCLDSFWESFFLEKELPMGSNDLILAWSLWSGPAWSLCVLGLDLSSLKLRVETLSCGPYARTFAVMKPCM